MCEHRKEVDARGFCSENGAGRRPTVLVIDDHDAVLDVLEGGLFAAGYAVLKASSGEDALGLFKENQVDVILCDLGMPHMDGWEVAGAVRDVCCKQGLDKPPMILVTAWADQIAGDERVGKLGIAAVLGKPVTMEVLVQTVEQEIDTRRRETLRR